MFNKEELIIIYDVLFDEMLRKGGKRTARNITPATAESLKNEALRISDILRKTKGFMEIEAIMDEKRFQVDCGQANPQIRCRAMDCITCASKTVTPY
jgi:hypothetical protein